MMLGVKGPTCILALCTALFMFGCGKSEDSTQPSQPTKQPKASVPVVGKWATDTGHLIEFRTDGRCTIEPFAGNQVVGTYTWSPANKEVVLSINTGLGKIDALWQVQDISGSSITLNVREQMILGKSGAIKLSQYREGASELKAEGQTLRSVEGMPFDFKAQVKFSNIGSGTLLLKIKTGGRFDDRADYVALVKDQPVSYSLPLKSEGRNVGNNLTDDVQYFWKKPTGEVSEGRVECKVVVEVAEATQLELGKPVKTNPKLASQWFQFEVPTQDAEGNRSGMYALLRDPSGIGEFFDSSRKNEAPLNVFANYQIGSAYLGWIMGKPSGVCTWRVNTEGKVQTIAVMPVRYALQKIERVNSTPGKALARGDSFTLDGNKCGGIGVFKHSTCWAAISFEAKAGRFYVNSFQNSASRSGWAGRASFLTDAEYQQFKRINASSGVDLWNGSWYSNSRSTYNPGDVPVWKAPSDGTFWLFLHTSDNPDTYKAWLYEIPAFSTGEYSLGNSPSDLRVLAEAGDMEAQNNLGIFYQNGRGVMKDYEQAAKWYRKAADQNMASAQNNLGVCYAHGWGVTKDEGEALVWYKKAADGGNEIALNNVAWIEATTENATLRNGSNAVILAKRLVSTTSGRTPANLDTLAAAHAEVGQFDEAVRIQQEAIGLLKTDSEKSDYASRLRLYENRTPYRAKE